MNWKEGRTWQGTLENRCNCFNPYFHFDHNYSFVKGRHVFDIGHTVTVDVFNVYIYGFSTPGCVTSLKACVEKVQVGRIAFDWCGAQTGINRNGQAPEDLLE